MEDWAAVIISSLISAVVMIIGYFITHVSVKKEIENTKKQSICENRKTLYEEIYGIMEELRDDLYNVYNDDYIEKLKKIKPKAYLFSSSNVKQSYYQFCEKVWKINRAYKVFFQENDPEKDVYCTQDDIDWFENTCSKYQDDNKIQMEELREILNHELEIMKKDLGIED